MRVRKKYIIISLLSILLYACNSDEENSQLIGVSWKCQGYVNVYEGTLNKIHPNQENMSSDKYTMIFNANGTVSGSTGANRFNGKYKLSGKHLNIYDVQQTFVYLVGENLEYEDVLFHSIETYSVSSTELRLFYDDGQQYLLYYPSN